MKLYRAVPITPFSCSFDNNVHPESIFFNQGFLTISDKQASYWSKLNNLAIRTNNDGKYFFFFPEDAIRFGHNIHMNENLIKLLEFEFPEEIAFSLVGNGNYQEDIDMYKRVPECLIEYNMIPGNQVNSKTIMSKENKLEMLKYSLIETFNCIKGIKEFADYNNLSYEEIFDDLYEEDTNRLYGYNAINKFLDTNFSLIYCPTITQRSWTINTCPTAFLSNDVSKRILTPNIDYLLKNGLLLQLGEPAINARNNFNNAIINNNVNDAKLILKQYHQQFPN